jgi:hypothetical protein
MKRILTVLSFCFFILCASFSSSFAQCGVINRAAGQTATASSADVVGPASGATDASGTNIGGYWKPVGNNGAQWLYVDLGSSYKICKVIVKWGRWNAASAFKLEVTNTDPSQSGTTWTEIDNVINNNPPAVSGDEYVYNEQTITLTNNSRYLRLYIPTVSTSDNIWVKELEVYSEVVNQLPAVSLVSPSGNLSVNVNTAINLSATASDADGTISKLEFFHGTTNLIDQAPQSTSPYTITWTPTTPGTYVITAKATDNNNASATSSSITVTVAAASATAWLMGGNNPTVPGILGTTTQQPLIIKTGDIERLRIAANGKVGINTNNPVADLTVNGEIRALKIKVTQNLWADYVFDSSYKLMPLEKVEKFIAEHKHLPHVPSAKNVADEGLNVGDNQAVLLRKIEELTLYLIEQDKKIKQLEAELKSKKSKKK